MHDKIANFTYTFVRSAVPPVDDDIRELRDLSELEKQVFKGRVKEFFQDPNLEMPSWLV